jgi:hypothetical protein
MKYRFEIIYCPKYMQRAIELLNKMDIDMQGAGFKHSIEFTSEKNPTLDEVKKHLRMAYEEEECKVLSIEGGTVE